VKLSFGWGGYLLREKLVDTGRTEKLLLTDRITIRYIIII